MWSNQSTSSSYYTHDRELSSIDPPVILSGSGNYREWRRAINLELELRKMLGVVHGTDAVPEVNDANYRAWKTCNKLVLSWIHGSISEEIKENVKEIPNAVKVWRRLRDSYSPGDDIIISDIKEEIDTLKQETRTVKEYFVKLGMLWIELETLHAKMKDEEKLSSFLAGLDERFRLTTSQITREAPFTSLDKAFTLAALEEELVNVAANMPDKEEMNFPNQHPHGLTLKRPSAEVRPFTCIGCEEVGFGKSYRCDECNDGYVLHRDCAYAIMDNPRVRHPFFKESDFVFCEKPDEKQRICDACRKPVKGFVYHCFHEGLYLHPCCFNLKPLISHEEEDVSVTLKLTCKIPKKCLKCKRQRVGGDRKVEGWAYVTRDEEYCYHVSCFKEMILEKLKEGCFSKENLTKKGHDEVAVRSKKTTVSAGGKTKKYLKIAAVVFWLVFAAIFGDPISLTFGLIEALGNF